MFVMANGIFWGAFAIMCISYIVYPATLFLITRFIKLKPPSVIPQKSQPKPGLAIVCAAYNEQDVILKKLENIWSLWNEGITEVWIGSDCSTDATNSILSNWCKTHQHLNTVFYTQRQGKIKIINDLVQRCEAPLILITDANIILPLQTISRLRISQVQYQSDLMGVSVNRQSPFTKTGIAKEERRYMNFENALKAMEYRCFGIFMGAEGSCLLITKSAFIPVPSHFKVDDFFLTMQMIRCGKRLHYEHQIEVLEDNPGDVKGEFIRKSRIANGNFQNLIFFRDLFFKPWQISAIVFWLHKGIRWTGPIWLFLMCISSAMEWHTLYMRILFLIQVGIIGFAIRSYYKPLRVPILRSVAHFYLMNAAIVSGFMAFLKHDPKSYWNPIKRHV